MVQTRKRAHIRQEATSDEDMETSPRTTSVPAMENEAHAEKVENNIVALIPQNNNEPTLLEITEPDITFEALSS